MSPPEIAVFGGSFDPPHFGHVVLAAYALSIGAVDRVLVAPTYEHPFGKPLGADFDHRLEMCRLAFSDLTRVEVSPVERALGRPSRTLQLVNALALRFPDHRLRLLIGADILRELDRWHRSDELRQRAPLLVAGRAEFPHPEIDPRAPSLPNISSTQVRAALARREDVALWVPRRVCQYVWAHGLYQSDGGGP